MIPLDDPSMFLPRKGRLLQLWLPVLLATPSLMKSPGGEGVMGVTDRVLIGIILWTAGAGITTGEVISATITLAIERRRNFRISVAIGSR